MKNYNIAIYTRISKEDITKNIESESITNQKRLINSFLENKEDLKNCNKFYYTDDGFSGSNFNRPEITKLLEDVKKYKINCIIVKDLSRFGRNYIQVNDYLDKIFPFFNLRFISINDNYDSINNKNTTMNLDIAFKNILHTYYIKELGMKSKATKVLKVKNGEYVWKVPFGYKKNSITKKLEIDKETAPIIKMIFNLQNEFNSYIKVSKFLNDNNIPTISKLQNKSSKKEIWKSADISQIVKNEIYIGNSISFKRKKKTNGNIQKIVKNNESEIIKIENTHEPIVDKNLFIKLNSKKIKIDLLKEKNASYIFSNKLKCGCCGYSLRYYKCFDNSKNIVSKKYYCNSWKQNSNLNCFKGKIFEENIKIKVLEQLKKELSIKFDTEVKNQLEYNKEIEKLIFNCNKSLEKLNGKKVKFYENYSDGIFTKDEYKKEKLNLENLICLENEKLEKLKIRLNNVKSNINFNELTKKIMDKFVEKIVVYDEDNIIIYLKNKFL